MLFRSKKGCKKFYDIYSDLETQNDNPICETMPSNLVSNENLEITLKERWESIYKICFYSVLDNNLIWFQYRVLFKILGTKDYLKKLKLNMNSQCLFFKQYEKNLEHLFCKCGEVIKFGKMSDSGSNGYSKIYILVFKKWLYAKHLFPPN